MKFPLESPSVLPWSTVAAMMNSKFKTLGGRDLRSDELQHLASKVSGKYFKDRRDLRFYWWNKPEYPEKSINLSQVIDKLYHKMLYRIHLSSAGFELTKLLVIGTDCVGSCKSSYHTITTLTAQKRISGKSMKD